VVPRGPGRLSIGNSHHMMLGRNQRILHSDCAWTIKQLKQEPFRTASARAARRLFLVYGVRHGRARKYITRQIILILKYCGNGCAGGVGVSGTGFALINRRLSLHGSSRGGANRVPKAFKSGMQSPANLAYHWCHRSRRCVLSGRWQPGS
jgi:hypothetical protein